MPSRHEAPEVFPLVWWAHYRLKKLLRNDIEGIKFTIPLMTAN